MRIAAPLLHYYKSMWNKEKYQLCDICLSISSPLGDTAISWRWRLSTARAAASLQGTHQESIRTLNFRTVQSHSLFRITLQKHCTVANMSSFPLITSVLSFLPTTLELITRCPRIKVVFGWTRRWFWPFVQKQWSQCEISVFKKFKR